jgi:hypothetical protein
LCKWPERDERINDMAITDEVLNELLKDYQKPEDVSVGCGSGSFSS